jgi:hypothetical protein
VRQRFYKIIVVCFLTLFVRSIFAQDFSVDSVSRQLQTTAPLFELYRQHYQGNFSNLLHSGDPEKPGIAVIKRSHYTDNFGFFCRKEFQFEARTKLPLRFRIGSLQQCNYLEGKR